MLPIDQSYIIILLLLPTLVISTPTEFFALSDQLPPICVVDKQFSYQIAADTFKSSDSMTYEAYNLPQWLSFDTGSQTFQGTPSSSDYSGSSSYDQFDVTLEATDSSGSANSSFTLILMSSKDGNSVSIDSNFNLLNTLQKAGDTNGDSSLVLTPHKEFSLTFDTSDFDSSSDSLTYYARQTSGHTPLPNWLFFDSSSLHFYGTAPSINSDIAPEMMFEISLIATTVAGYTSQQINFIMNIGAHQFTTSLQETITLSANSSASYAVSYDIPMDEIYLDGSPVNSSVIGSVELSDSAPSFISLNNNGDNSYEVSGTVPSSYTTKTTDFYVQVYDTYGDAVYINFELQNSRSSSSSSSSMSSTTSSSSSSLSATSTQSSSISSSSFNSTRSSFSATKTSSSSSSSTSHTSSQSSTSLAHTFSTRTLSPSVSATASSSESSSAAALLNSNSAPHKKNKHVTAIACGVIIPVFFILLCLLLFFIFYKKRKNNQQQQQQQQEDMEKANKNTTPFTPPGGASGTGAGAVVAGGAAIGGAAALAGARQDSSDYSSDDEGFDNEKQDRTLNDKNADALNNIPAAISAESALDNTVRQFLDHTDSSSANTDHRNHSDFDDLHNDSTQDANVVFLPHSNSLDTSDMYSPIRNSYASSDSGNLTEKPRNATTAYYNAQPSNKESWRYVSDSVGKERHSMYTNNSSTSAKDQRSSYHTLNSIGTNEFMNTELHQNSNIKNKDPTKSTLLNVRDSVFEPKTTSPAEAAEGKTSNVSTITPSSFPPGSNPLQDHNTSTIDSSGTLKQSSLFEDVPEQTETVARPDPPAKRKSNLVQMNDMSSDIQVGDATKIKGEDIQTL
ncbi:hypothetical protein ACO0QE_001128 [Hanseniaspora vineae]